MFNRLTAFIAIAFAVFGVSSAADAADKLKAVASFSVLGDMVQQVGGDRVEVTTLVGPNGDAHVFSPTPADAKALASADVFFVNGLGFEGWIERLERSSGFEGEVVVASKGVKPLTMREEEGHHHHGGHADSDDEHENRAKGEDDGDHDEHTEGHDHDHEYSSPGGAK